MSSREPESAEQPALHPVADRLRQLPGMQRSRAGRRRARRGLIALGATALLLIVAIVLLLR
jgi:hypothetical protein